LLKISSFQTARATFTRYNQKMDFYCYAVTAPGIWPFTAQEMESLGAPLANLPTVSKSGLDTPADPGGLDFRADLATLYRLNLRLRTPGRILVRLGNFFYARTFDELRQSAARLAWERFIHPGQPVEIRATCHKSKLYHSGAVVERIGRAIEARLGQPSPEQKGAQRILARLVDDRLTVSIDSSGENLHKRGYRLQTAKAPLRETLAAALLIACGWDGNAPLLDPFCGSGTIPIEAALLALNIAPGLNRRFAFMDWPNFDEAAWQIVQAEARAAQRTTAPPILASDRDEGAIRIALANAETAGVAEHIEFTHQAVSAIQPPEQPGWVVTNPPYGARVSANRDLRNLYAQFGNVLRAHCPGWQVGILSSDRALLGQTGLTLETGIHILNGGLPVILARGRVE
jgi:putative N6-adenine-specific DNA methylase